MLVTEKFEAGVRACQTGDYTAGIDLLKQAAAEDPSNPQVHFWLAKGYQKLNRKPEAVTALQQALHHASNPEQQRQIQTALQKLLVMNGHSSPGSTAAEPIPERADLPSLDTYQEWDTPQETQSKTLVMTQDSRPVRQRSKRLALPRWQSLALKTKVTLLALALGITPVAALGAAAYYFVGNTEYQQAVELEVNTLAALHDETNEFLFERYNDVQVLASLPVFSNAEIAQATPNERKQALFNRYKEQYGFYDNIVLLDLEGNVILQSESTEPITNQQQRPYFQQLLSTQSPVFTEDSSDPNNAKLLFADLVRDEATGQAIGVVRTQIPARFLDVLLASFSTDATDWRLMNQAGLIIASSDPELEGTSATQIFDNYEELAASSEPVSFTFQEPGAERALVTFEPVPSRAGLPDSGWYSYFTEAESEVFAGQREILSILLIGTGVAALGVGLLAILASDRAIRPLLTVSQAVEQIGQGALSTRVTIAGEDELAQLGQNINGMADRIQLLLNQTQQQAEQRRLEQERLSNQVDTIAQAVNAIASGDFETRIPSLADHAGLVQGLAENINQMTQQIQELVQEQERLTEEQKQLAEEKQREAENLSQQVLTLLNEVKDAARGNLTVRAKVGEGEMGAVADSFNYLITSLRRVVTGIQDTAAQVNDTTGQSLGQTAVLEEQARVQTEQLEQTLAQIEQVVNSIQAVTQAAERAEGVVQRATQIAQTGGQSVDRTVEGIGQLRQTIGDAAKMMKRLGESSQQIGQIVTLISQIASKTDLLALNATIEAARAGEQGQGFAVVADEVRKLAERSATATKEIAEIVEGIQSETSNIISAMDMGTEEVVKSTQLAADAKLNLEQIIQVSYEINQLVQDINLATQNQTQTAAAITEAVQSTRSESTATVQRTQDVSVSLGGLTEVVEKLNQSVRSFQIG